jgi:hypothetical protein
MRASGFGKGGHDLLGRPIAKAGLIVGRQIGRHEDTETGHRQAEIGAAEITDRRCRDVLDLAHIALPSDLCPRRSRGRFFNIDLINTLEADSRAARLHRQLVKPAI